MIHGIVDHEPSETNPSCGSAASWPKPNQVPNFYVQALMNEVDRDADRWGFRYHDQPGDRPIVSWRIEAECGTQNDQHPSTSINLPNRLMKPTNLAVLLAPAVAMVIPHAHIHPTVLGCRPRCFAAPSNSSDNSTSVGELCVFYAYLTCIRLNR